MAPSKRLKDKSKEEFMKIMYQAGIDAGLTDAAARVMAAQAAHESNFGQNDGAGNNFWGIKAGKSWKGSKAKLSTWERDSNGKKYRTKSWFRVYDTPEEAIADRVTFMESRFPGFNQAETVGDAYDALQSGKYGKYYTDDRVTYEKRISDYDQKYLGGHPVPPGAIPGVASLNDIGDSLLGNDIGAGIKKQAPTPMPSRGVQIPQAPNLMPGRPAGIDAKVAPTPAPARPVVLPDAPNPMPRRPDSLLPNLIEDAPVPRQRPATAQNTGTAATPEDAMYGVRLPPESSPSKEQGMEAQVYDEDVWNNLGFGTGLAISAEQDKLLAASAKASDSAQTKVTESKAKASNAKSWSTFPEVEIAGQVGLNDGGFGDKKSYTENLIKQVAPKPIETAVRKIQTVRQRTDGTQTTTQAAGTQESSPQGTPPSVTDARKTNPALNPAIAAPTIDETRAEQNQMRNRISPAAGAVLPELAIPQAPTPMPGRPTELSQKGTAPAPKVAPLVPEEPWSPTPMPGRPAGIDKAAPAEPAKKSAPSTESEIEVAPPKQAEETVKLKNGKTAKLGTYKNEKTGNTITVTKGDDGYGHIQIQRSGLIDLGSEMNAPTIVGAIIRSKVAETVQAGAESVAQNFVPAAQTAASNAIEAVAPITEGIGGVFNNVLGMFGGGDKDPKTLDQAVDQRNGEIASNPATQIEVIPPQGPQGRGRGGALTRNNKTTTGQEETGSGKTFTTTNTNQTIRAGETVKLSGGRTGVIQEDGSIIDSNGRRSKGSSGQ